MRTLGQLHHDHLLLDAIIEHFDTLLQRPQRAHVTDVQSVLGMLNRQLMAHIDFEESRFYHPLQASGHARSALVERLLAEHQDLRATLGQLVRFHSDARLLHNERFLLYSAHLIDLYREHAKREHAQLFPLLEQPAAGEAVVLDALASDREAAPLAGAPTWGWPALER